MSNIRDGGLFSVDQNGTVTELHFSPRASSHVAHHDGSLFVTSRGGYVIFRYDLGTEVAEIATAAAARPLSGRPNTTTVGPDGALYFNHTNGTSDTPVHIRKLSHEPLGD